MNYIKHLNSVFQTFTKDSRLNPTHISLYMALFQIWNINRFPPMFFINREEVMQLSKIGSKATYHRCIKELSYWEYVIYTPSHNPYKGSQIKMFTFGTTNKQEVNDHETGTKQALIPYINNNKPKETIIKRKLPKTEIEVIKFFKTKKWPALEGLKFFNHYQSIGWKIGGKVKITDWQAIANSWMLKSKRLQTDKTLLSQKRDNLKTTTIKNYDEPL
ncbi:hypothetical protein [Aquimarina algicola]|uniref:Uncharacterized protein n=1 Tax=Aquimarina algicola TaxID=2589995 RepID=A0A504J119_9FLAO|nr:hypothetical protein [Aquimarina algicola]TPN84527.1 hypothetical protein FHK87_16475 [Aquimarina algicola]